MARLNRSDMEDNTSIGREEIEQRFGFHKATIEGENATGPVHRDIRRLFVELGVQLDALLPHGRAKAYAFTMLQTASMWMHWAVAEEAPIVTE
jgi:hypothetical protein